MAKNKDRKSSTPQGKASQKAGNVTSQTSKEKKESRNPQTTKKPQAITKATSAVIAAIVTLAIVALGAFYLIVHNSDMLFMAQSKDYFTTNSVFLTECMQLPGGFISWVSAFLTQFFFHPAIGAAIMIAIWVASLWLSKWAFRVQTAWMAVLALPLVCLLVSTIDIGYWLYYIKQTGYWFYGTVGYFIAMALVLFHSCFKKRADRIITTVLIAFTYPFAGWYTLLTLIYIAVLAISRVAKEKALLWKIARPAFPLLLAAGVPLVCYHLYPEMRIEDAWTTGFPYFTNDKLISYTPEIPFMLLAAIPLLFPFLPKQKDTKGGMVWIVYIVTAIVLIASWLWVEKSDFQNYNYHAEMRMYRAADEQDWDKVLDEMSDLPGNASREMVLFKNVALLNKGEMGTKMFKYNNMGEPPTNGFDTLRVHMVQTAAPLLYYYHGKTNFTVRWCIENSVEFGYDYDNLKMLARCALVSGEMDAAKKYLNILRTTLFYKDWAENLMPITDNPKLIKQHHEFDNVRELRDHMGSVLDGDNGLCEMYLLNYFSNTMNRDSKLLQELTLNYALIQKDIQLFWPRFFLYAELHKNQQMPVHYQEAAYLYGNLEPNNVDISRMPFDASVKERYQGFQQLSQSLLQTGMKAPEVGEALKSNYGDTFYWFYFFCRDIHSY